MFGKKATAVCGILSSFVLGEEADRAHACEQTSSIYPRHPRIMHNGGSRGIEELDI